MINVTIQCNRCYHGPITFASAFEPNTYSKIRDTQYHIDTQYAARCDACSACDWEVTGVEELKFVSDRDQLHAI